ncbi:MAG: MCE family protein [Deltaproteobacteria bacterium]|nr:MCE family protein [Deltaproteobacteria bacterium]
MKPKTVSQIRVGSLVFLSLFLLGAVILFMGKEKRLFENRVPFDVHFSRTVGLRVGAPISLGGVTVGSVENLSFPRDVHQNYIVVRVKIVGEVAPRIRKSMVARIRSLGLLGDKYIELSGGGPSSEPLAPGGVIASVDPIDYEAILGEGGDLVENFTEIANSLKNILRSVEEGKGLLGQVFAPGQESKWRDTAENLREASGSLRRILGSVERGDGLLGQLVQNREAGRAMMDDLGTALRQVRRATESGQRIAEKLEKGEGTLGTLIQDPNAGREILASLKRSTANLETVVLQLQKGEGLFQRLIADKPYADNVLSQLEGATRDLAQIIGKIEDGEGTLGALVNDPKLYHEAHEVLGSIKHSWLLSIFRFFRNSGSSGEQSSGDMSRDRGRKSGAESQDD